jgi:HEAT repeat protein
MQFFDCTQVTAQALGIAPVTAAAPLDDVFLDFPLVSAGTILTARVVRWRPEGGEDITVLELASAPPPAVMPAFLVVAVDPWQHQFQVFGFPRTHPEGIWVGGAFREKQPNGWVELKETRAAHVRLSSAFRGSPVWDEQESGIIGMVIVPEEASHASSAFAIPAETLFKVWPEANRQITNELTVYLELLAHRFSRVPEYFPSHLTIDQIHQAIRVNQCPPRRRWQEQAQSRELTPWTGNCSEAEPLSRWQALEVDAQAWGKQGAAEWNKVRLTLKRAVLLGVPGSGKSWLLHDEARRVAREQLALLQARTHVPGALVVPIYLRLGAVAEEPLSSDADIGEALVNLLQRDYPSSEQLASWLRQQLLGPRCLLLLAGRCLVETRRTLVKDTLVDFIIQGLLTLLHSLSVRDRKQAALVLAQIGTPALEGLLKHLQDSNEHWEVREAAAEALGKMGAVQAVGAFLLVLRDRNIHWRPRCMAAWAVGQIGERGAVEPLLAVLRNEFEPWQVRCAALEALGQLGDPQVIEDLLIILRNNREDVFVYLEAVEVMREIGEPEVFLRALHHKEWFVRRNTASLLRMLGVAQAIPELLTKLQDRHEHWEVRSEAARSLGELGDARVVETPVMMLRDKKRAVRREAAESLGKLSDPRAVPGLLEVVQRREIHWEIRLAAVEALGHIGDSRAVEALLGKLQNEGEFEGVRSAVVQALGELGDVRAMRALLGTLQQKGRRPRPEIAVQLDDLWTMETWQRALRSENESMRWAAVKVMHMLQTEDQQAVEDFLTTQWNLAEDQRVQRSEGLERTAARALAGLIPAYDPRSFCEQLLDFWSQHALDRTAQVLLYELLERLAAQLRAEVGEAWPVWRTRLLPLTDQALDLGLKRS